MATSTRENRRRKIAERGSERLAFMTGRIQNLPPPSQDQTDGDPPQTVVPHDQDPPPNFSSQPAVSADAHDKVSSPVLLKHDPVFDSDKSQKSANNGGTVEGSGSVLHRGSISMEPLRDPGFDASDEFNSLPVSLDDQSSFVSSSVAVQSSEIQTREINLFTPKQISSAIDASGKTRILCSIIVAILVVLSHWGFPLLGNRFLGSIISFRPLYFIMLTNLTVVLARLLFENQRGRRRAIREENKNDSTNENKWVEQVSKTLEVGLVTQKIINAVFLDCSVYAITVICGLSFT